jgi:hypothetical protein
MFPNSSGQSIYKLLVVKILYISGKMILIKYSNMREGG